jgi:hypothetical protein
MEVITWTAGRANWPSEGRVRCGFRSARNRAQRQR